MSSRIPRPNFMAALPVDRTPLAGIDVNVPPKVGLAKVAVSTGGSGTRATGKNTATAIKPPLVSTGPGQARMSRVRSSTPMSSPKSTVPIAVNTASKRISHTPSSNVSLPSKASVSPQATSKIPTTSSTKPKPSLIPRTPITPNTNKRSSVLSTPRRPASSVSLSPAAATPSRQILKVKTISHIGTNNFLNRARLEETKPVAADDSANCIKEEAGVEKIVYKVAETSVATPTELMVADVPIKSAVEEAEVEKIVYKDHDASVAKLVPASCVGLEVLRTSQCILESEAVIDDTEVEKEKEKDLRASLVAESVSSTSPTVEDNHGSVTSSSSQKPATGTSSVIGSCLFEAEDPRSIVENVIASRPKPGLRPLFLVSKHRGSDTGTSAIQPSQTRPISRCRSVSLTRLAVIPSRADSARHASWPLSSKCQEEQEFTRRSSMQPMSHFYRQTNTTVSFGWIRRPDVPRNASVLKIEDVSKKDEKIIKEMEIAKYEEGGDGDMIVRSQNNVESDGVVAPQDGSTSSLKSAHEVSTNLSSSHLVLDSELTNAVRAELKEDDSKKDMKVQIFDSEDVSIILKPVSSLDSLATADGPSHTSSPIQPESSTPDFNQDISTTSSPQSDMTSSTFFADSFETSRSSLDREECLSPTKELNSQNFDFYIDNVAVVSENTIILENPNSSRLANLLPDYTETSQYQTVDNIKTLSMISMVQDQKNITPLHSENPCISKNATLCNDLDNPKPVKLTMKERRERLQQRLLGNIRNCEEDAVVPKPDIDGHSDAKKPSISTCTTDRITNIPSIQPSGSPQAVKLTMKERQERLQQRLLGNARDCEEDAAVPKPDIDGHSDSKKLSISTSTTGVTASASAVQSSGSPQAVKMTMKERREQLQQRLLGNIRDCDEDSVVSKPDISGYSDSEKPLIPKCTTDEIVNAPSIQSSGSPQAVKLTMKERQERLQQRLLGNARDCEEDAVAPKPDFDGYADPEKPLIPTSDTPSNNGGSQSIAESRDAKSVNRDSWAPLKISKKSAVEKGIEESSKDVTNKPESGWVNRDDALFKSEMTVEDFYEANDILDDYYVSDSDKDSFYLDRPEWISNTAEKRCSIVENANPALSFSCSIQDINAILSSIDNDVDDFAVYKTRSGDLNIIVESVDGDSVRMPGPLVPSRSKKEYDVDRLAAKWKSKATIAEEERRKSITEEISSSNLGWSITTIVKYSNGEFAYEPQKSFIPSSDMAPMTSQPLFFPPTLNFPNPAAFSCPLDGESDRYPLDYYSLARHIERTVGCTLTAATMRVKVELGTVEWNAPLRDEDDFNYWVINWSEKAFGGELELEIVLSEDECKGLSVEDTNVNDEVVSPAVEWPTQDSVIVSEGDDAFPIDQNPSEWTVSATIRSFDGSKSKPYTFKIPTPSTSTPSFEILQLYTSIYLHLPLTGFQMRVKVENGGKGWYEPIRDARSFNAFVDRTHKGSDNRSLELEVSLFSTNHETLRRYIEPPPVEYVESVDSDSLGTGSTKMSYSSSSEESTQVDHDHCINRNVSDEQGLSDGGYELVIKSSLASQLHWRSRTLSVDRIKSGLNKGITKTKSVRKGLKKVANFFKK